MSLRFALFDNHPIFMLGLRSTLEALGHEVVLQTASSTDLTDHHMSWDLLIADPMLLPMAAHSRKIARLCHSRPVIILGDIDTDTLMEAMHTGVKAVVCKSTCGASLTRAINEVRAGRTFFDPQMLQRAVHRIAQPARMGQLTKRERDIAMLVRRGLRNRAIANELTVTEATVTAHLNRVYRKMGIRSRAELMTMAK